MDTDDIRDGLFNRDPDTGPETFWASLDAGHADLDAVLAQPIPPDQTSFWALFHQLEASAPPPQVEARHGALHHRMPGAAPCADAYRLAGYRFANARKRCLRHPYGSPERAIAIEVALEAEAALQAAQLDVRQAGFRVYPIDSTDTANPRNRWRWGP